MSRCFPFPPPGYENKLKAENLDLLTKEKRKEKKHKKERREKEKKERKEKKEKDRSKDKHKEKKDRKEKHKDKKKDKDIDKGRTSEDSIVQDQTEGPNELHIRESFQKEEINDSKFAEELGRRTRDDGAANQMVGSIASSVHRKFEGVGVACTSLEKERVADKKMFPVYMGSAQRNDGSSLAVENAANSFQRTRNISTATSMEKERSKFHEKVTTGISSEQNRNQGIFRPIESTSGLVNRKAEYSTAGMENEKSREKNMVSNSMAPAIERGKLGAKIVSSSSASTQRRNEVLGMSVGNLSSIRCKTEAMGNSSIHSRMEGMVAVPETEKERVKGNKLFPHAFSSEQRRTTTIGQPVEKDRYHKVDRKDKNEDSKDENRKRLKEKDHSEKKSKPKDADKHTKEKEEKIVEKAEEIENNNFRNFGKKDQVDALYSKPLAPHKDITAGIRVDETMKKRTDLKTNGFLQENDARPNKIPRMTSSSQPLVNDKTLELHLAAPFSLSFKEGSMNNSKPDRILDNKEKKINGTAKLQQLPVEVRPPAAGSLIENGEVSLKLPHPDSKYLHHIYNVPKMEAWSEIDDSDWLFNCCDSQQKLKKQPETEEAPLVWAEAFRIDSADVFALPYVVPF